MANDIIINGVPLVVLVIGIVEWLKRLGVSGKSLNLASMLVGLVIGMAYHYANGNMATPADVFGAAVYGLALGLIASGVYDAAKSAMSR